jgi:hypothetical protein
MISMFLNIKYSGGISFTNRDEIFIRNQDSESLID